MEENPKTELIDFDPAEYLTTPEAQAFFLSDALSTGSREYILDALNAIARAHGMTALAKEAGVRRQALYVALGENGNPTLDTLLAVVNGLGIRLRAEVVAEQAVEPELADA